MSEQNESSITVLEQQVARLILQVNALERNLIDYATAAEKDKDIIVQRIESVEHELETLNP